MVGYHGTLHIVVYDPWADVGGGGDIARVLPSRSATASTASSTFWFACLSSITGPSSASLTAASRLPAHVLKSLGLNSSPMTRLT